MAEFALYQYPVLPDPQFVVSGSNCQVLTLPLESGKHIITEPGNLIFSSPEVEPTIRWECCNGKCCSGEGIISVIYTNNGPTTGYIGLTPWFPAKVIPIDLGRYKKVKCRLGSYFADNSDVHVGTTCTCNIERVCCAGLGCFQQEVVGDGMVFLAAGGTIIQKELEHGERIVVDNSSVLAWQDTVRVGAKFSGSLCYCCFGGEGLFNTTLTGPGLVVMESMSFAKLHNLLVPKVPPPGQAGKATASVAIEA